MATCVHKYLYMCTQIPILVCTNTTTCVHKYGYLCAQVLLFMIPTPATVKLAPLHLQIASLLPAVLLPPCVSSTTIIRQDCWGMSFRLQCFFWLLVNLLEFLKLFTCNCGGILVYCVLFLLKRGNRLSDFPSEIA